MVVFHKLHRKFKIMFLKFLWFLYNVTRSWLLTENFGAFSLWKNDTRCSQAIRQCQPLSPHVAVKVFVIKVTLSKSLSDNLHLGIWQYRLSTYPIKFFTYPIIIPRFNKNLKSTTYTYILTHAGDDSHSADTFIYKILCHVLYAM